MKTLSRYGVQFALALLVAAPLATSGCILVVEEDGRDRHRHIGTEWYLEVVFYRTQSFAPNEEDVRMTFVDESRFEGTSACGAFEGTYSLGDGDAVSIDSIEADPACTSNTQTSAIFMDQLVRATTLNVDDERLQIRTDEDNYLSFVGR